MVQPPNPLIALIGTVVIFFIVAYVESTRIELPLAHGMARGARGRYPIRLMYASNIPVILVAAVLANVSMFSLLFWQHPEWPLVGHRSEEHTSELQSLTNLVCRLLLEKKKQ